MKSLRTIVIALILFAPIGLDFQPIALQTVAQTSKKQTIRLDDLSKVDFKFSDLPKYETYKNQTIDGIKEADRIKALRVVSKCINHKDGATRPSTAYLSSVQAELVLGIFKNKNPTTIKRVTKGQNFKSLTELKNYINEIY